MLPYTVSNNPFNDPHLDEVYVWKKKAKKLGWSKPEAKAKTEALRAKNIPEITNAKRRRVEREAELAAKQLERDRQDRERDSASFAGWEVREEQFMLKQHQQASALRINQGRERAIDLVARNVLLAKQLRFGPEIGPDGKASNLLGDDVGVENTSPLDLFEKLTKQDLLMLMADLRKYRQLEGDSGPYAPFWDALVAICEYEMNRDNPARLMLPGVVRDSIHVSCIEKTPEEIQDEIRDARNKLVQAKMDEERLFYNELVKFLETEEARSKIIRFHDEMVQVAKQNGRGVHLVKRWDEAAVDALPSRVMQGEEEDGDEQVETPFNEVFDLQRSAKDGRTDLIKPRYWNRVKNGYDWNKYNRAHYDRENPPPKSVVGYKFNILYPGLKATPDYKLEPDPTDPDNFIIIHFIAAPPYADVAFRIENRDWERGVNSGFKSTFEGGMLQLHFNFVRRRYRR